MSITYSFSLFFSLTELSSLSWDDLESNLPDELIPSGPNGDLGLMAMPSNGGGAGTTGLADAAAKHKQLSELLRAGSGASLNSAALNSSSPASGGGMGPQLGALGKSPLGQGSPSHASPTPKPAGAAPGAPGNGAMGLNAGFSQAILNNGMMPQSAAAQQQGQVMNGTLGPGGRGRGTPGMQYQGAASVGQQVVAAAAGAAPGGAGSVLAETLTQGAQQMGMNAQQAGNMNKVRDSLFPLITHALHQCTKIPSMHYANMSLTSTNCRTSIFLY